jgi:hypothetical protein
MITFCRFRQEEDMSDLFERIKSEQNPLEKIVSKIPGFDGYMERQHRRSADKILRETIADRFEEQWQRISALQEDLVSQGELSYVDDLEKAALKLRTFIDRIRRASYGYAGFFDAIKVNQEELTRIYQYDAAMLEMVDEIGRAIDNVETSIGTDGLPAAIRNLVSRARESVELFNRRKEVITEE